jgi:hypothetical protein
LWGTYSNYSLGGEYTRPARFRGYSIAGAWLAFGDEADDHSRSRMKSEPARWANDYKPHRQSGPLSVDHELPQEICGGASSLALLQSLADKLHVDDVGVRDMLGK